VADIEVQGECPRHMSSNIKLTGLSLGNCKSKGDNFMEQEMLCGDFPVGATSIWCILKTPGILAFTLVRRCMNPSCQRLTRAISLFNEVGTTCKKVKASVCCSDPKIEFTEMYARLLHAGEETLLRINEIEFPHAASTQCPTKGVLCVIGYEDRWVALKGPMRDYFKFAQ
jgi:hypothetical protein